MFTLVIWIFAALSLILAILFYLLFLWHYIPKHDGGLSGYCERKINSRLARIVSVKVNKALEEEERKRIKADQKAIKKGERPVGGRQATLPQLFDPKTEDQLPAMPMLNRNDTTTSLPGYSSRPGTPSSALPGFELGPLDQKSRPFAPRHPTNGSTASNSSFASNAPLMGNQSDMGYARSGSPAPSLRSLTSPSVPGGLGPQRNTPGPYPTTNFSRPPAGPPRIPSAFSDREYTQSPVSYDSQSQGRFDNMSNPGSGYGRPPLPRAVGDLRSNTPSGPPPSMGRRTPASPYDYPGNPSPAPSGPYSRSPPSSGGYQAYNPPQRSATNVAPPPSQQGASQQYRNMTDPGARPPSAEDYFSAVPMPAPARSATAMSGSNNGLGPGRATPISDRIARLASPAPYNNNMNGRGSPAFTPGPPNGYRQ